MAEQRDRVTSDDQKDPKFVGCGTGIRIRCRSGAPRIRIQAPISRYNSLDTNDDDILDFGRDANRLDYFRVIPFDVDEGNDFRGVANYGGGTGRRNSSNNGSGSDDRSGRGEMLGTMLAREWGGTRVGGGDRTGQVTAIISSNIGGGNGDGYGEEVGPILNREWGSSSSAGGGNRTGQVAVGISANIGGDSGYGGGVVVGPILDHEMGSTEVYANNGSDNDGGGEVIVQRPEQEKDNHDTGERTGQVQVMSFRNNGGGGGFEWWIDRVERGGLVAVAGWWKKWWWFLALWK